MSNERHKATTCMRLSFKGASFRPAGSIQLYASDGAEQRLTDDTQPIPHGTAARPPAIFELLQSRRRMAHPGKGQTTGFQKELGLRCVWKKVTQPLPAPSYKKTSLYFFKFNGKLP